MRFICLDDPELRLSVFSFQCPSLPLFSVLLYPVVKCVVHLPVRRWSLWCVYFMYWDVCLTLSARWIWIRLSTIWSWRWPSCCAVNPSTTAEPSSGWRKQPGFCRDTRPSSIWGWACAKELQTCAALCFCVSRVLSAAGEASERSERL